MNRHVADPHWHGLVTAYFFLGGIAAGAYAVAMLAALFGDEEDRRATRSGRYLAWPLVAVCGVLLIVDLGRPERFWHMLIQSNTYRPMFKGWSPMSFGSWGLSLFGAFSFGSFLAVLRDDGWWGAGRWRWVERLRGGWAGRLYAIGGLGAAFFLGSYTGALLTATNQPIWADTTWIAPLFLASAISTGVAAVVLLARWPRWGTSPAAIERLETLDTGALLLEMILLGALALSLGGLSMLAFGRWPGMLLPAFVVPIGLVVPLVLRTRPGTRPAVLAAVLVLLGGLALRAAVVGIPPSLLASQA